MSQPIEQLMQKYLDQANLTSQQIADSAAILVKLYKQIKPAEAHNQEALNHFLSELQAIEALAVKMAHNARKEAVLALKLK